MAGVTLSLLQDLLVQGVLEPAMAKVFLSRPFVVPKKDLSIIRLVVDFSRLNQFISRYRFRMLTVAQVSLALSPGAWFTIPDLENA